MEYVVGCLHLDDASVLQYRRGGGLEEMNSSIERRWNSVITPDDHVYVLGDFAARNVPHWQKVLNGTKTLVRGNHDPVSVYRSGFVEVVESKHLLLFDPDDGGPMSVFMSHYPHASWPGKSRGGFHLHAHSHGKGCKVRTRRSGRIADMSIDGWPGWPLSLLDVIKALKVKE